MNKQVKLLMLICTVGCLSIYGVPKQPVQQEVPIFVFEHLPVSKELQGLLDMLNDAQRKHLAYFDVASNQRLDEYFQKLTSAELKQGLKGGKVEHYSFLQFITGYAGAAQVEHMLQKVCADDPNYICYQDGQGCNVLHELVNDLQGVSYMHSVQDSNYFFKLANSVLEVLFKYDKENKLVKAVNLDKYTPLAWFLSSKTKLTLTQIAQVASLLIEKMEVADLCVQDKYGWTALMYAAANGYTDVVKLLLSKLSSEDLNTQTVLYADESNDTIYKQIALHVALNNPYNKEHSDIALLLIDKMNVGGLRLQDSGGWTALIYAAVNGYADVVKKLVAKLSPADLNTYDAKYKDNALMWALICNHPNIALLLIDKMNLAGLTAEDAYGFTPLTLAMQNKYTYVIVLLQKKLPSSVLTGQINNSSQPAVTQTEGDVILNALYSFSPDNKWTASQLAQAQSYLATVHDLNVFTVSGDTLLIQIIRDHFPALAMLLIDKMDAAGLVIPDNKGRTPLMWAAYGGYEKIVDALLARLSPKDLNAQNSYKETALSIAIQSKHSEIALKLINKMDLDGLKLHTYKDMSALGFAVALGLSQVVQALLEKLPQEYLNTQYYKNKCTLLVIAIEEKKPEIALKLIYAMNSKGLAIPKSNGMTPLMMAVQKKYRDVVTALISKLTQEDLNAQESTYKQTALIEALNAQDADITLILVKAMNSAGLRLPDSKGNFALLLAFNNVFLATVDSKTHREIMRVIISKLSSDDLNIIDSDTGSTILVDAFKEDLPDIALLLIQAMNREQLCLPDSQGNVPLLLAVNGMYTNVVQALVSKLLPEDLNIKNTDSDTGNTALVNALNNADAPTAVVLAQAMNKEGLMMVDIYTNKTPEQLAQSLGFKFNDVVAIIKKKLAIK